MSVSMKPDNVCSKLPTIPDVPSRVSTGLGMEVLVKAAVLKHLKRGDKFRVEAVQEVVGTLFSKTTNPVKS